MAEGARSGLLLVIDRISIDAISAERDVNGLPHGLWVILDPQETQGITLPAAGEIVKIERPDGSTIQVPLDGAAIRHGVMGLQFCQLAPEDIPRLSQASWELGK
jgi:hypothetical protein